MRKAHQDMLLIAPQHEHTLSAEKNVSAANAACEKAKRNEADAKLREKIETVDQLLALVPAGHEDLDKSGLEPVFSQEGFTVRMPKAYNDLKSTRAELKKACSPEASKLAEGKEVEALHTMVISSALSALKQGTQKAFLTVTLPRFKVQLRDLPLKLAEDWDLLEG